MNQLVPILNGGGHVVIDVRDVTLRSFAEVLHRWGDGCVSGTDPTRIAGVSRVIAAFDTLNDALESLGDRDATLKAKLSERRDALAESMLALESVSGVPIADFATTRKFLPPRGPAFVAALDRYEAALGAAQAAQAAMRAAGRDTVLARRADLDLAEADSREAARALDALHKAVQLPSLPKDHEAPFAAAKQQTAELVRLSRIPQPARAMFAALEQGRAASPAVAALWPCFERAKDVPGDLFAWRRRAYAEEHPSG